MLAAPNYSNLLARLPRTFVPSLNDQFHHWDSLFPAEQRRLAAQLDWLASQPEPAFKLLFDPIIAIESKMDLPRWQPNSAAMSITDTGILARSPLYPQWRTEVEKVFTTIDKGVTASGTLKHFQRILISVLPAGLPINSEPLWPDLAKSGQWFPLPEPFSKIAPSLTKALAERPNKLNLDPDESTWVIEAENAYPATATHLSWTSLEPARKEFLKRLNSIKRDLKSADQTSDDIRRLDMRRYTDARPRIREFIRSVFLTGNGSLVFNNSFVQWSASEALRRAEPQVLIAAFGIRQKLKPFSSVVLFEDQQTNSNPTPDAPDPAGSLIDAMMLARYVHLSATGLDAYRDRTLSIFAIEDLNRVLIVGPAKLPTDRPLSSTLVNWLS